MGHRDTLLCDTTYPNATTARSATRESVRRKAASFKSASVYLIGGRGLEAESGLEHADSAYHSLSATYWNSKAFKIPVKYAKESAQWC